MSRKKKKRDPPEKWEKGLPYPVYEAEKKGGPTRKNLARQAVDEAISVSSNMKEFELALKSMGYTCNFDPKRKYWTIKLEGWKKVMRLEGLGPDYSNERIRERIAESKEDKTFAAFHVAVKASSSCFWLRNTIRRGHP